ncbi:hypothetical protein A3B42_03140 [Candidatus Daviesbacteria bacterium RIFCSPLOWO2_01_FULL_38_10]|uniref:Uncharacterized protein n=1 Tax=Candidatus Daviesbacteria bacterium GW2011_GWF2_38_6 TaxID=1618432 RepID=A0A0G0NNY8_9BACT|nr:MAG: hypothetical protein US99_C0011G0021 [Candidatus Daviesbacteria bacterium GW2011_GWF2_38_6]OGE27918.1 MAG: hypothetical protein A3D02_02470 [Candidatus Daviesbacteria bacterium RIFCSPHIGHO2_02_FULL_39_41]OGE39179.1 MAG: hypothetical protein A3B42_03140 [Candidatus Daviesbacteria bacterium RIFCSPLOWO2_01_FULL_38_10]OGE45184.1 MAG: hypothetical protein A3E67_03195 [Candidatus Daviesbacteria bacterium RIFCSPHIGHO2_12_FULL_38_25]OGE68376.1 MAG: hypothetical protein A3H81_02470 [Candidatus D
MKTLVTHINPHLDDIAAIWLFKKFHTDFKDAGLEFISAHEGNLGLTDSDNKVYFGVGRGKFDEHKGDLEDCATSLVWKDIQNQGLAPKDEAELKAYEELVEWSRLIDLGRMPIQEFDEFSVQAFIRPHESTQESSKEAAILGEKILDRILSVLKRKQQAILDWEKAVEFQTEFGKTIAIISETVDREFCRGQTADLFLMYNPKYKSVQFFTPSFEIDLKPIYDKVKLIDPEASWFLHQSHHMVICGSSSAPDSKPTKLTFEQLIELVKSV